MFLEDSEPVSTIRGRTAYFEPHSIVQVGEGCCHDRSHTEDDKSSNKKLSIDEHEVERKGENLGMRIWMWQYGA